MQIDISHTLEKNFMERSSYDFITKNEIYVESYRSMFVYLFKVENQNKFFLAITQH